VAIIYLREQKFHPSSQLPGGKAGLARQGTRVVARGDGLLRFPAAS